MANIAKTQNVKALFAQNNVQEKFQQLLGSKAQGFLTSVLQVVSGNDKLAKADPNSVLNAAAMAAALDLPINNNLNFAYIIPYSTRQSDGSYKQVAQFQIGYKGLIQLAQRTGLFKTISASPIYEGQLIEENPLTGFVFDFTKKKSEKVIGYASYFKLHNGFEKSIYMTIESLKQHGAKYSKTYGNKDGIWNKEFDGMGIKTVLKLLLSKYAPLSIEMQKAITSDQSIINDEDGNDFTYVDNEPIPVNKLEERLQIMLNDCSTVDEVLELKEQAPDMPVELFNKRILEIEKANKS